MDFEFGQTTQSEAFFDRHPKFYPAFERLMALTNKCFGRSFQPKSRTEDICFSLGQTCRQDFLEVLFLAAHGYGIGASKTLRGLYERAVTLAYMVRHAEKAERFVRFAAIQEHKAMKAALTIVSEIEFDEAMKPLTAKQIRDLYGQVKPEFQTTLCKKCGRKGTAFSWDIDVASMVRDVGAPYGKLYLGAYVIPNFHIHATLASTHPDNPNEQTAERNRHEAEFALQNATIILLLVIRSQDALFSLNLGAVIDACEKDVADVWIRS